jgi:hypothetical protein
MVSVTVVVLAVVIIMQAPWGDGWWKHGRFQLTIAQSTIRRNTSLHAMIHNLSILRLERFHG